MNSNIVLIILGEPNSTFSEVLFKYFKSNKFKKSNNKIILIGNKKLIEKQMKKLKYNFYINHISDLKEFKKKSINIINVGFKFKNAFSKITSDSNRYIEDCFDVGIKLMNTYKLTKLINGPISKKHFLKKRFPGITEYIGDKTNSKDQVMLIYNENLSVTPLTTHIPIKKVAQSVKKKKIIKAIMKINEFYKTKLFKKAKFAVLGLNPHCETIDKISEEKKIIIPAINLLKKINLNIEGPYSADTFFLKKNIIKYDVVVGMYHDQVLTPLKTLYNFKAINITLGLPFLRISPDHGPNIGMLGKNKSDPSSIFYAMRFVNKIK